MGNAAQTCLCVLQSIAMRKAIAQIPPNISIVRIALQCERVLSWSSTSEPGGPHKLFHKSKKPVILSEREGSATISSRYAGNDQRFFAALRMTVLFMR